MVTKIPRILNWLTGLLAALLFLCGLSVWLLPPLLECVLTRLLQAQGLNVQLHVNRVSLWRAELGSVHLGVGPDSSWIADLTAEYTPGGLCRGRIDRVVADTVVLTLRKTGSGWWLPGGPAMPAATPAANSATRPANTIPVAELQVRNVALRLVTPAGETRVHGHATVQIADQRLVRFDATLVLADGMVRTRGSTDTAGRSGIARMETANVRADQLREAALVLGVLPDGVTGVYPAGRITGQHYLHWRDGQVRQNDGAWSVAGFALGRGTSLRLTADLLSATLQNEAWTLQADGAGLAAGTLPQLSGFALQAKGTFRTEPAPALAAAVKLALPEWGGAAGAGHWRVGPAELTGTVAAAVGDGKALTAESKWQAAMPCRVQVEDVEGTATADFVSSFQVKGQTATADLQGGFRDVKASFPGGTGACGLLKIQVHAADVPLGEAGAAGVADSATGVPAMTVSGTVNVSDGDLAVQAKDIQVQAKTDMAMTVQVKGQTATADLNAGFTNVKASFPGGTGACGLLKIQAHAADVPLGKPGMPGVVDSATPTPAMAVTGTVNVSDGDLAVQAKDVQVQAKTDMAMTVQVKGQTATADLTTGFTDVKASFPGGTGACRRLTVQAHAADVSLREAGIIASADSATRTPAATVSGTINLGDGEISHASGLKAEGLGVTTPFRLAHGTNGWLATIGAAADAGRLTCREAAWQNVKMAPLDFSWVPVTNGVRLTGGGQVRESAVRLECNGEMTWLPALAGRLELSLPRTQLTQADPLIAALAPLPAGLTFSADLTGRLDAQLTPAQGLQVTGQVAVANGEVADAAHAATVRGIATTLTLEDLRMLRSAGGQELTFQTADMANLHLGPGRILYRVEGPTALFLEQADVGWANGTIRGYSFRFNPLHPEGEVTLYADRIEIRGVLNLLKDFKGDAAGLLYGRFPLRFQNGAIRLSEGFLFCPPGQAGQLQLVENGWLPAALAQSGMPSIAVDKVKAALADFEFSIFRLDLETTTPKNALLRLRLVGGARLDKNSPPIDLNINVRGPLENLLNLGLQLAR